MSQNHFVNISICIYAYQGRRRCNICPVSEEFPIYQNIWQLIELLGLTFPVGNDDTKGNSSETLKHISAIYQLIPSN